MTKNTIYCIIKSVGAVQGAADGMISGMVSGAFAGAAMSMSGHPMFCFVAGTTVLTTLGKKAIETVKVGDVIPCVDHITGETAEKRVITTTVNKVNRLIELDIDGEIIKCTETHPFQVKSKGWVDACNLNPSDIVYTKDWNTATVKSVNLLELDDPVEVFNFEVEDCHTYFVGEQVVLVHNKCVAKDGDYKAIVNELNETEAPHAHILKNGFRIAKVDINGNIIKGSNNKGVVHFVSKYRKIIVNGIKKYYPKL